MNEIIERIRRSCLLGDDAKIGVRACMGSGVFLRSKENTNDIVGTATTDDVDAEKEVVIPQGADISYINANRKVFVDHWTDTPSLAGYIRTMKLVDGTPSGWRVTVALAKNATYAPLIAELASTVGIGFSIGFEPTDYGPPTPEEQKKYPGARIIIRKWKWFELSFTPFPCNVSCQTSGMTKVASEYAERALKALRGKSTPESRRLLRLRALVVPTRLVVPLEVE